MRLREIIVCRSCKGTDCQVDEIFEEVKVSMEEYGQRYPRTFHANALSENRTARRFVITCQDCGEQHEFIERIEPSPPAVSNLFSHLPIDKDPI